MNIISQIYNIVTTNAQQFMGNYSINMANGFEHSYSIYNCKQFIDDFDKFTSNLNIDLFKKFIFDLDQDFMNSSSRKELYHSKGFINKTILTKFGYITLKRRRYINKLDGSSFIFVDRFLGLEKYCRFDPFVIADLCEEAACNSYAKAGRIVSKSIGTKIKYNDDPYKFIISRATSRNIVIKASEVINEPIDDSIKETQILNIMLDEKFVGSQFNDGKDHMIKAAVLFEDTVLEYKNRNRLVGKKVFGSVGGDLLKDVLDYIYYNYDTNKLKNINFMGDGASWIKSFAFNTSFKYHKDVILKFGLDHYHLAQAIQRIVTNKHKDTFSSILKEYIIYNLKSDFITVVDAITQLEPTRIDTINQNKDYILNNWDHIQNTFHNIKYKCSMESNISHVFADIFTSRPKAYSTNGIKKLLKIRLLSINGYDLKKLYFEGLKTKNQKDKENDLIEKICISNSDINTKYYEYFCNPFPFSGIAHNINI